VLVPAQITLANVFDGENGQDGQPNYTWLMYADDETGAGISENPQGKRFMGIAVNKDVPTESLDASNYSWSSMYEDGAIVEGKLYNGVSVDSEDGFKTLRSDNLVRSLQNATRGFVIQRRNHISQPWTDVFYVDQFGKVTIAEELKADRGIFSGSIHTEESAWIGNEVVIGTNPNSVFQRAVRFVHGERKLGSVWMGDSPAHPDKYVMNIRAEHGIRFDSQIMMNEFTNLIMQNGWVTYSADYYPAQFMIDPFGFVHIRGSIKNGVSGQHAFTLPEGYRPSKRIRGLLLGEWTSQYLSRYEIYPTGQVYIFAGAGADTARIELADIKPFKAEL